MPPKLKDMAALAASSVAYIIKHKHCLDSPTMQSIQHKHKTPSSLSGTHSGRYKEYVKRQPGSALLISASRLPAVKEPDARKTPCRVCVPCGVSEQTPIGMRAAASQLLPPHQDPALLAAATPPWNNTSTCTACQDHAAAHLANPSCQQTLRGNQGQPRIQNRCLPLQDCIRKSLLQRSGWLMATDDIQPGRQAAQHRIHGPGQHRRALHVSRCAAGTLQHAGMLVSVLAELELSPGLRWRQTGLAQDKKVCCCHHCDLKAMHTAKGAQWSKQGSSSCSRKQR